MSEAAFSPESSDVVTATVKRYREVLDVLRAGASADGHLPAGVSLQRQDAAASILAAPPQTLQLSHGGMAQGFRALATERAEQETKNGLAIRELKHQAEEIKHILSTPQERLEQVHAQIQSLERELGVRHGPPALRSESKTERLERVRNEIRELESDLAESKVEQLRGIRNEIKHLEQDLGVGDALPWPLNTKPRRLERLHREIGTLERELRYYDEDLDKSLQLAQIRAEIERLERASAESEGTLSEIFDGGVQDDSALADVSSLSKASRIFKKIAVVGHSVLGSQMRHDRSVFQRVPEPIDHGAIVDSTGLPFIRSGPLGAGGSSKQIYEWLGIHADLVFPGPVVEAIKAPLMAKLLVYEYDDGAKNVIHVAGPNFKLRPECSREDAVDELAQAYRATLKEFVNSELPELWLLPISSELFSGHFASQMPQMTAEALVRGCELLDSAAQDALLSLEGDSLKMCIYMEDDLQEYTLAFASA